ncbi:DUF4651 domain-containing protein [Streptococcus pluranimalium]|uniref:hypothetical protein n=1 Tax=Streptococcus pluranimalium TaxID=82348 RepID=UPI0039E8ABD5
MSKIISYIVPYSCIVLLMIGVALSQKEIITLREQNKSLSEHISKLPEAFGGVGYISDKTDSYIDVVGYGRFVINNDESQFLDKGDKAPQYILERGQ